MATTRQTIRFLNELPINPSTAVLTLGKQNGCGVPFKNVEALDVSDYEGAEILHDLNTPTGPGLDGKFGLILDGGTLEHVFNVPVALDSCKRMLSIGGWFVSHQLFNFSGHGFYSLTPELFWRWSESNGFTDQKCVAYSALTPWQIRKIVIKPGCREEWQSLTHGYFIFAARKAVHASGVPHQAGPSIPTNAVNRWLVSTRLSSRPIMRWLADMAPRTQLRFACLKCGLFYPIGNGTPVSGANGMIQHVCMSCGTRRKD